MSIISGKKVIFWDFDGVIKETIDIKADAFVSLFADRGSEIMRRVKEHHEANGGMSRYQKFSIYLEWCGEIPTEQQIKDLSNDFSALVFEGVINAQWVAGAQEYLVQNPYDQVFILVSATPAEELLSIIARIGFQDVFRSIFGAPVAKRDAIAEVLAEMNINKEHAVMIGDATADYNAALENGIAFVLRKHKSNKEFFLSYEGLAIENITELL